MGWFDEQIRQRKSSDDAALSESLYDIIGAACGNRVFYVPQDDRKAIKNEIDKILRFYGVKSRELPDAIKELDDQLEYLFRPHGIMRRSVMLKGKWYKNAVGPMLAKKKTDGSVVALLPAKGSGYWFADLALGKQIKVTADNAESFENKALCFYKPFPQKALTEKELVKYVFNTIPKKDIAVFSVITFILLLISTIIPVLYNILFGTILHQSKMQPLIAISIFLVCVTISTSLISAMRRLFLGKIRNRMKLKIEAASMMRVLSLPADFFKKHSSGTLSNNLMSIEELCEIIAEAFFSTGLTALFSLVFIVQIYIYTPSLLIWTVLAILVSILYSVLNVCLQMKVKRKQTQKNAEEQGLIYALISGIQKIKLVGAEKRAFARWGKVFSENAEITYNPPFLLKISEAISTGITLISGIVIYYIAVRSQIAVADFYAFNSAYGILSGTFVNLAGASLAIAAIKPLFENIRPFFEAVPEVSEEKEVISRLSGGIELNGVSFKYDEGMPNVIDNLSLKIRPGQYIAVVGTTGCGKSTLLRLMLGFEKPQRGAVYYDGKDLSKLDLKSLRRKIGVVMQDGKLFQGDIFSNIAITSPCLTLDEAWEAAEMAGVAEDIRNMPMGMHTIISEGSGGISGGQRQRILIARAIASKPRIIMFDEATSALDNIAQKIVSESLDKLKCTRIVIAHRLSTIKQCGRIIVLDKGKIAEDGTYDELLEKNGLFAELVSRQKTE